MAARASPLEGLTSRGSDSGGHVEGEQDLVAGTARDVRFRTEIRGGGSHGSGGGATSIQSRSILTFRIERDATAPVPVELRGLNIDGVIADGDLVEVAGPARPGRVLKASTVVNRTTGVPVVARGMAAWAKVLAAVVIVWVIAIFAWVGYSFLAS
jgi:hypothetical protein